MGTKSFFYKENVFKLTINYFNFFTGDENGALIYEASTENHHLVTTFETHANSGTPPGKSAVCLLCLLTFVYIFVYICYHLSRFVYMCLFLFTIVYIFFRT